MQITMDLERETKGTFVYKARTQPTAPVPLIETVYLRKEPAAAAGISAGTPSITITLAVGEPE